MDLRTQQKAERRERILAAARSMIGERGYEGLTMRELARSARVTVPTIYNLIGSKEEVLLAAVQDQTQRLLTGVDDVERRSAASHALAVSESVTRELLRLPKYYRSLLKLLFTSEAARSLRSLVHAALVEELDAALLEIGEAGELEDWVNTRAVAGSVTTQMEMTGLRWVGGELDDDGLKAAMRYGAAMMLYAATRGRSAEELRDAVEGAQARVAADTRRDSSSAKPASTVAPVRESAP